MGKYISVADAGPMLRLTPVRTSERLSVVLFFALALFVCLFVFFFVVVCYCCL